MARSLFVGLAFFVATDTAAFEPDYLLVAIDLEGAAAVFETPTRGLFVVRSGGAIADSGFRLSAVTAEGVAIALQRSYQGHALTQSLALGEKIHPEKIVELEESDRRAAHALDTVGRALPAPKVQ